MSDTIHRPVVPYSPKTAEFLTDPRAQDGDAMYRRASLPVGTGGNATHGIEDIDSDPTPNGISKLDYSDVRDSVFTEDGFVEGAKRDIKEAAKPATKRLTPLVKRATHKIVELATNGMDDSERARAHGKVPSKKMVKDNKRVMLPKEGKTDFDKLAQLGQNPFKQ